MLASELIKKIENGEFNETLCTIYQESDNSGKRYVNALKKFIELHTDLEVSIYSAPGRSEIGGNHTDHQHGQVLAGAIDLDMICVVSFTEDNVVELISEGFSIKPVDLSDLSVHEDEIGTSESIIRGTAASFVKRGKKISGFKGYMISDVLGGSGLSSSAAFESLIGSIFSYGLNDGSVDSIEIAKIGQEAENVYFGKPCGLMDQMACSVGGFVYIDFASDPVVKRVNFDMNEAGYSLCIIDTKGSHADLTPEYAAIPAEMKSIAKYFGKEFLNEIDPKDFYTSIPELRKLGNDRAIMRAFHFLAENARVPKMVEKLENKDVDGFFKLVSESGNSSYKYLQNVYAITEPKNQEIPVSLAYAEYLLQGKGIARVHGGGFAGTIQAYVRNEDVPKFKKAMNDLFGEGSVYVLHIRQQGGIRVIG